eukprot:jgi/Ulvmu1/3526/UM163_0008.1
MAGAIESTDQDAHRKWKHLAAPMYDWMTNHHLVWPGLACRFGKREQTYDGKYNQVIYYSDQVGNDQTASNKLIKQNVDVLEEGYSPMDHVNTWKENQKSPYFGKKKQIIYHPGECNRIIDIKQMDDMVVTHSDCEEVFVWDFNKQPVSTTSSTKQKKAAQRNTPDLRLTGHTLAAPFALSTSAVTPTVASGGEDRTVLLWNLEDYSGGALLGGGGGNGAVAGEALPARSVLRGHTKTITSVAFKPGSDSTLMSTSDDHIIKLWDTRQTDAVTSVAQAAELDVLSLDWSGEEHYVATGADGGKVHVYDVRKMGAAERAAPLLEFQQFTRQLTAVLTVAFSPRHKSWLLSSGNDGRVSVFDTTRAATTADGLPPQLVMQHIGHIGNIMDAQWSPHEDFMAMSVSNDGETYKEGGALQLWRLSWLLTSDFETAEAELRAHQKWLETGKLSDLPQEVHKPPQPPMSTEIPEPAVPVAAPVEPPQQPQQAAPDTAAPNEAMPADAPAEQAADASQAAAAEEPTADAEMAEGGDEGAAEGAAAEQGAAAGEPAAGGDAGAGEAGVAAAAAAEDAEMQDA